MQSRTRVRALVVGGALVAAGFGAGAVMAATGTASAATQSATSSVSQTTAKPDPTRSMNPDEHLLTGITAAKVRAAALAKYPGATIRRVETDSDGVYEAHVVTTAGAPGGHGGPGGHGDGDGDGPTGTPPSSAPSA